MSNLQQSQTKSEEIEIDLHRLLRILLKRKWLICFVAMFCALLTYCVSRFFVPPTYRSYFTAYVNNRGSNAEIISGTTTSDLNASISLTYLYQDIILSRSVLMDAATLCGLDGTYKELHESVTTTVSEDSGLITVYVKHTDPEMAALFASAIAESAPGHVARMRDGSSMRILDKPVLPDKKFAPSNVRNGIIGGTLALILYALIVIVVELVNDIVRSADELEQRYQVVVIGMIPNLADTEMDTGKSGRKAGS